ncbi:MAG: hypothetical protein HGB10_11155 [Coriobacteriia bacterium]|nr:hypothetical protein [Coriobacteriia bacterium]
MSGSKLVHALRSRAGRALCLALALALIVPASAAAVSGFIYYSVTYVAGPGGSITGSTPQSVLAGLNATPVTATASPGYHFVRWSDLSTNASRQETNINHDATYRAFFGADEPVEITAAYGSFDATTIASYKINGSAALGGGGVRLTPSLGDQAGSMFWKQKVSLRDSGSFATAFTFRIDDADSFEGGADGFTFCIQPGTNSAFSVGSGLGYGDIPDSLAVEFDTFANGAVGDPDGNHVGIDLNGSVTSTVTAVPSFILQGGDTGYAWIEYDGDSDMLYVRVSNSDIRPSAPLLSKSVDLYGCYGPDVFLGFTASTGGSRESHDILQWYFTNRFVNGGLDPVANEYVMGPATIDVTATPATIARGGTSTINLAAYDENGAPADDATLTLSLPDGGSLDDSVVKTDANGLASATFTAPSSGTSATVRATAETGLFGETDVALTDYELPVVRLWGPNRAYIAAQAAETRFGDDLEWAERIILVNGEYPHTSDAIVAAGLGGALKAPVLYTYGGTLPLATRDMLERIGGRRMGSARKPATKYEPTVYLVGGTSALPDSVKAKVETIMGDAVFKRAGGATRWETAASVARMIKTETGANPARVLLANGRGYSGFYDAATLAPIAGAKGYPILYTGWAYVPDSTTDAIRDIGKPVAIVAGGKLAVSSQALEAIDVANGNHSTSRWSGGMAGDTAYAVANKAKSVGWLSGKGVSVTGRPADAAAGAGALGGADGAPLLYTSTHTLSANTRAWIVRNRPQRCYILGDGSGVSTGVRAKLLPLFVFK